MLSQNAQGVKKCYEKHALPMLEAPRFVRLKFSKVGKLQFISHLDLHRTFNRAIIRAGIPAWYTKGFNPHTKLVFATPLSIGAQSTCEYLDVRVEREMSPTEIMNRLNAELPGEMQITDAFFPTTPFSDIVWSEYTLTVHSLEDLTAAQASVSALFAENGIVLPKKTKSGEKDVDIRPMIRSLSVTAQGDGIIVNAVLSANSREYLNPEMLIKAILKYRPDVFGDKAPLYSIGRNKVLLADGVTEFR